MQIELPDHINLRVPIPVSVVLEFSNRSDTRSMGSHVFEFYLLDESGHSPGRAVLAPDSVSRQIPLQEKQSRFRPNLAFGFDAKRLKPNARYQLVCVAPSMGLIDSKWFTLEK
ncbi:MAG TPA: hypothetical protein VF624_02855 [Tepidisphaeraceae bacterium]|jgi:hypothetical protein